MTAPIALAILIGINLAIAIAAYLGVRYIGRELGMWD